MAAGPPSTGSLRTAGKQPGTRTGIVIAAVGAMSMLLLNAPAWAIVCAAAALPLVLIFEGAQRLRANAPGRMAWLLWIWGYAVGVVGAALAAVAVSVFWIDDLGFHPGAAGFGGSSVASTQLPGIALMVLMPLISVGAVIGATLGSVWLLKTGQISETAGNATWSGLIAGAAAAEAGVLVALWPMILEGTRFSGSVSDWTSLVIGFALTRPVVYGLLTAIVVHGIWADGARRSIAGIGLLLIAAFALGDLVMQSRGSRQELVWHLLMVALSTGLFWRLAPGTTLNPHDSEPQPGELGVTCSVCGRRIPSGAFCSYCGARVPGTGEAGLRQVAVLPATPTSALDSMSTTSAPGTIDTAN